MNQLTLQQRTQLAEEGFVLIKGVLSAETTTTLLNHLEHLWHTEGANAGSENYIEPETRRLANLADKGDIFRPIYMHPLALESCRAVMGADVRLSMLNARDALPRSGRRQSFHCDTDNSGRPDEKGFYACTTIWMLDDFTTENGATYLVPRTHLTGKVPKDVLTDRTAPHPDEIRAIGERGDLFIFNGHCWHAGGENRSDQTRRAILAHYLRADQLPARADRRQSISAENALKLTDQERVLLAL